MMILQRKIGYWTQSSLQGDLFNLKGQLRSPFKMSMKSQVIVILLRTAMSKQIHQIQLRFPLLEVVKQISKYDCPKLNREIFSFSTRLTMSVLLIQMKALIRPTLLTISSPPAIALILILMMRMTKQPPVRYCRNLNNSIRIIEGRE